MARKEAQDMRIVTLILIITQAIASFAITEQELVESAKKEGQLIVSTNKLMYGPLLLKEFTKKYPFIKVTNKQHESYNYSHWSNFKSKDKNKRIDAMFGCQDYGYYHIRENGYLMDLSDLPSWNQRPEFFKDQSFTINMLATPHVVVYNKNKVKESDLPSRYEGFLDKKWRKKIGIRHVASGNTPQFLAHYIMNTRGGLSWYEGLAQNKVAVYSQPDKMMEDLSRGKIEVAFARDVEAVGFMRRLGKKNNLDFAFLKEDRPFQYQFASISKNAVHPAAAKLLINWVITEGQQVLEKNNLTAGKNREQLLKHPKVWRVDYETLARSHGDVLNTSNGYFKENGARFMGTINLNHLWENEKK